MRIKGRYDFYTDPGHGWLKIKRDQLKKLGIEDKISSCSYQLDDDVYLEEDKDAGLFVKSLEEEEGGVFLPDNLIEHKVDVPSSIRSYNSFRKEVRLNGFNKILE